MSINSTYSDIHSEGSARGQLPTLFNNQRIAQSSIPLEIARFCAIESLPHSIVDGGALWRLLRYVQSLNSIKECGRRAIKDAQAVEATSITEKIYKLLRGKTVTLAIDGWTDVNKTKVHNVVILHEGVAYYYKGIFLCKKKSSAINILHELRPIIDDLLEHKIYVVAFAADDAKVMNTLYNKVKIIYPWLVQVRCVAHTLQLIIKYMLEQPAAKPILCELFATISFFERNSALQNQLFDIQPKGNQLELKRSVPTRWSSHLYALQRFIQLKEYIIKVLATTEKKFHIPINGGRSQMH